MVTVSQPRFTQKLRSKNKALKELVERLLQLLAYLTESKIANEKSYHPSHLCKGHHTLAKCTNFLRQSVEQHSDTREKGLCYG